MNGKQKWLWYAAGLIPAVWLGLLIAPAASGGLPEILRQFPSAMNEPFHIEWCEDSLKTVLVFIALYAMVIGVYLLLGLDSDTFYIYHVAAVMVDNLRRLLLGINLSDKAIMDFDFPGVGFPV